MASRRFVLFYPFRPCGSFDFSRIGLRTSGGVCRFCQLVFLRRLLVAGAYRFPLLATLVRSSRSSSRLARLVWRLVAIFFFATCLSSRQAVRLSLFVLLVVHWCLVSAFHLAPSRGYLPRP